VLRAIGVAARTFYFRPSCLSGFVYDRLLPSRLCPRGPSSVTPRLPVKRQPMGNEMSMKVDRTSASKIKRENPCNRRAATYSTNREHNVQTNQKEQKQKNKKTKQKTRKKKKKKKITQQTQRQSLTRNMEHEKHGMNIKSDTAMCEIFLRSL